MQKEDKDNSCEEWGKKIGIKWGEKAEAWGKKMEKKYENKGEEIGKKIAKPSEYIAAIIINFILLFIYNRLQGWIPFLTDAFSAVLPLLYISSIATIIANFIFLLIGGRFVVAILKVLLNAWSVVVMITMYIVFPFDFSAYSINWDLIARILIIIGIIGTIIGTIVEFTKTISEDSK